MMRRAFGERRTQTVADRLVRSPPSGFGDYDRLRRLFDHAADAIFGHGPVGRFTGVNLAACETLGYTREKFLRMN